MKVTSAFMLHHEVCKGVCESGIRVFCFFVNTLLLTLRDFHCGWRMCSKENMKIFDLEKKRMIFFLV
jgi:hypothetical protein